MIDEEELRRRTGRLTLEQKVRLLTGAGFWALHTEPGGRAAPGRAVRRAGRGPRRILG